ncbi:hypothetical protein [Gordonia hydrophobica]|uniref:Uncharacterized protein n=1 Tax=Gordonia hydrophobica TaxID=40516 RepID=A0ABZ2U5W0_9ACTN|nr:hypothetical protein [Gordonia hydrophobica]MBM7365716.1 hypothetical protein [Gordonia hydrophobica]
MTAAPSLRIAIEYPDGPDSARWVELTEDGSRRPERFRAATLLAAQKRTAGAAGDAFVDLDVLVAASVSEAYDRYREVRPGWRPGAPVPSLVHPGTVDTLAGLLADIAVTGVADGVTLTSRDAEQLLDLVYGDLAERLVAHGADVRFRPR